VQAPTCKLTEELIAKMAEIVRKGNFRMVALQRLGISKNTYSKWMEVGRKQIRDVEQGRRKAVLLQGKLVIALDDAEGFVHGRMIEDILKSDNVAARQWYLERRFNKLYSRNPAAHLDDETGETVKIDASALLAEKLAQLVGGDEE
jgi:hypothetical protein